MADFYGLPLKITSGWRATLKHGYAAGEEISRVKILKYSVGTMGTNCYFLIGSGLGECAVVDPGDEAEKILGKLSEHSLKCSHILLTHAHFDHIMALEPLRQATGAKVYLHEDDADFLTDSELNLMSRFSSDEIKVSPADILLNDGDIITVAGEELRVMHTPGHTPGSVCYICGRDMISGDTLFRDSIGRYDFPGGDFMTLLHSLKTLAALDGDYKVYPGHGMTTTLERERSSNLYLN